MTSSTENYIRTVIRIRPVSAIDPMDLLQADVRIPPLDAADQTVKGSYWWSPEAKQMWFQQYCQENKLTAKIVTEFIGSETLPPVTDSSVEGQLAHLIREHWRAVIQINGEKVSEADATGFVKINSFEDRKYSGNQTRKYAIGAALSQLGFGAVSTFPMQDEEIQEALKNAGTPIPANPAPVQPNPAVMPIFPAPHQQPQAMPNSFFGVNPASSVPPVQNNSPAPAEPENALDAAKKLVWIGTGRFKGQSLGQILGEPGGVKNLQFIANDYSPRNAEGQRLKEAAQLILSSLQTGH